MNIKQQALEAARPHAKGIDDLIEKASKIEAYLLGNTSLTPPAFNPKDMIGPIVDLTTNQPIEIEEAEQPRNPFNPGSVPANLDADVVEMLALAKELTADLGEMGFVEPDQAAYNVAIRERSARSVADARLKRLAEEVAHCDIAAGPIVEPDNDYLEGRKIENFIIPFRHRGAEFEAKLRPIQIKIAESLKTGGRIINVTRGMGASTMIAAFAREAATGLWSGFARHDLQSHKVLVITNTHTNALILHQLIDDSSVTVLDFDGVAMREHAGEHYSYIVIDNAAYIPYALEDKLRAYIEKCEAAHVAWQSATYCSDVEPIPTRVTLISVPGQERGWFYELCVSDDPEVIKNKMTGDWRWSAMTNSEAAALKEKVGADAFANQFENKFRPVRDT
jgi:hypothetical protein